MLILQIKIVNPWEVPRLSVGHLGTWQVAELGLNSVKRVQSTWLPKFQFSLFQWNVCKFSNQSLLLERLITHGGEGLTLGWFQLRALEEHILRCLGACCYPGVMGRTATCYFGVWTHCCRLRPEQLHKAFWQCWHWYGFSWVWILWCWLRWALRWKALPHTPQA